MFSHFKFPLLAAAFVLSASTASAAPINLVSNGSFENDLTGWQLSGDQGNVAPAAIYYNRAERYPIGASGEAIPTPTTLMGSPDAAGSRGLYLVSDRAVNAGLTQSIFLTAGSYRIGFDAYAPYNGFAQPSDALFRAVIAGVTLANFEVSEAVAGLWTSYSGLAEITSDGFYDVSFLFNSGPRSSKDMVVDRAFIVASEEDGGTPIGNTVPEPGSLALMGLGLAAMVTMRKGKKAL